MVGISVIVAAVKQRAPDAAWDALVRVTHANPDFERGRLNVALISIRSCCERDGLVPDDIPREIELRASWYGETFPGLALTPTALARHWYRVAPRNQAKKTIDKWKEKQGDT